MEIPGKISILHRRLGLCKPVEHKSLIVLLYKYPLPAIERARLKMRFRKKGLFVRMAVEDIFGTRHHLKNNPSFLNQIQELIMSNACEKWKTSSKVYFDLIVHLRSEYKKAANHCLYFNKSVLPLFRMDRQGHSLTGNELDAEKAAVDLKARRIADEVWTGKTPQATKKLKERKRILQGQAMKRMRLENGEETPQSDGDEAEEELLKLLDEQSLRIAKIEEILKANNLHC